MNLVEKKIAVIGLGYVGLPLAVEFAKKYKTVGFDISNKRISELKEFNDITLEVKPEELKSVIEVNSFTITSETSLLNSCNIFIITVPTPTDKHNRPVLTPLYKASETVSKNLKKGDIVIYESTVYPGVTEDECVPVLEKYSNLKFNKDFYVGYSPERINPGDKERTVTKIKKITSGSNDETANAVDFLYKSIITAGTYKASSIKVAEAAKVIENAQRDINIAFVNELAKIFNLAGIDTNEVLMAAGTKWNFLNFKPGLVGGHCIGVDPFYLAQKAQELGYHPEIILAGRRLNDSMGSYVADQVVKNMLRKNISVNGANVLLLGFTFKENCPDIRNTRVIDIYKELELYRINITVYDPWANPIEVVEEYQIKVQNTLEICQKYDAIILAVAHESFKSINYKELLLQNSVVYDVKGVLPNEIVNCRL